MPDSENVIKELEEISDYFFGAYHHSKDREETNKAKDRCDAVENALALLKEQQPVKPRKQKETRTWTVCGNCSQHLISQWSWCPYCGTKVKWDG